jgi:hypothetical protein
MNLSCKGKGFFSTKAPGPFRRILFFRLIADAKRYNFPYLCTAMKALQKITSVFLAVTFLVSSLGFTANKMVCLKSGKTRLSLLHVKDCCPEKKSSVPVIKSDCCDITNTFFDLGDLRVSQKIQVVQPFAVQYLFASRIFALDAHSFSKPLAASFADLPPPVYGRTLLSLISTFLI